MNDLGQNLKELVIRGIDAIGNTASSLASSTRQKVNELSLRGQRNEIMESFGEKAYAAWKNGMELPESLAADLREVMALDEELFRMKDAEEDPADGAVPADRLWEPADDPDGSENADNPAEEPDKPAEEPEIPVADVPEEEDSAMKDTPVSDAIDGLFRDRSQMEQMAGRINSSLSEMGKQLLQFSADFGKKLSEMADELMGNNDRK